ncbi:MAG: alpha/beta fold hydrolase [Nanoarchaeota archaeon]
MVKKIYLVHGWGGSSQEPWFNWLKKDMEKKKFEVHAFDMPDTENPKISEWVNYLRENIEIDEIDEHTYFVGHSIGCQTILRFLEKLPKSKKIGGCIFVAPWLDLINIGSEELEIVQPWINSKIDFGRILTHDTKFFCIFSDNDPYVHLDEAKKFKDKLGAKIIFKKKQGHFNSESGVKEIPEILQFLR